jgi:hypothetical protein
LSGRGCHVLEVFVDEILSLSTGQAKAFSEIAHGVALIIRHLFTVETKA